MRYIYIYMNSLTVNIWNTCHILTNEINKIINFTGYYIIRNTFLEIWLSMNVHIPESLVHLRLGTQFIVNAEIIYIMIYNT
jgi:hypothetical protein